MVSNNYLRYLLLKTKMNCSQSVAKNRRCTWLCSNNLNWGIFQNMHIYSVLKRYYIIASVYHDTRVSNGQFNVIITFSLSYNNQSMRALWLVNQLWFIVPEKIARLRLQCVIYEFFSCSTNIPHGLSAYKP